MCGNVQQQIVLCPLPARLTIIAGWRDRRFRTPRRRRSTAGRKMAAKRAGFAKQFCRNPVGSDDRVQGGTMETGKCAWDRFFHRAGALARRDTTFAQRSEWRTRSARQLCEALNWHECARSCLVTHEPAWIREFAAAKIESPAHKRQKRKKQAMLAWLNTATAEPLVAVPKCSTEFSRKLAKSCCWT